MSCARELAVTLIVAFLLTVPAHADEAADIATGKTMAETHCATCHAVGPEGDSPRQGAPRFRELSQRFPIDNLEEALAEGIMTGHPDMPEFELSPEEIGALLAYLQSIQVAQ